MSQVASVASADYRTSWARAISCFQEALSQDISKRHTMLVSGTEAIQACGRRFQWQQAGSLLGVLQGHALADLVSYNSAIGVCQKCQNWSLALGLLSVISLARLVPDIISFNSLMSACEGHWAFAVDLLGRVEKQGCESPNVITYSTVINACDKGSCWFVALFILETMQKRVVLPNVVTFSSAISRCAEGGRWDIAIFLLISMAAWRVDRNVISYNCAISACEATGQWAIALSLLTLMEEDVLQPDVVSYNTAISACAGRWAMAWQHFCKMRSCLIRCDAMSYHNLGHVCRDAGTDPNADKGNWLVASFALQSIRRGQLQQDSITCSLWIRCGVESWHMALRVLSTIANGSVEQNCVNLSSVLSYCKGKCPWQVAFAVLGSGPVDTVVCNGILRVLDADQWFASLAFFENMCNSDQNPSIVTFSTVMKACKAKWLMTQTALSRISHLQLEQNVVSFGSCMDICEQHQEWMRAMNLFVHMSLNGLLMNLIIGNSLLGALRSEEWAIALGVFELLGSRSILLDEISYNGAISACKASVQDRASVQSQLNSHQELPKVTVRKKHLGYHAVRFCCFLLDEVGRAGSIDILGFYTQLPVPRAAWS